ncbi:MAG: single-stranded DNA-binding protein [Acidobacteria bacterium]|nr:single-stranded DNA-binding protein [Acidobacteriota bacterium]
MLAVADELSAAVAGLAFPSPVAFVYNPLEYARACHRLYLERYAAPGRDVMLLGMNPGPWGMAQTGVPFGEVTAVRDWMGLDAPVARPAREHPARPVDGFRCRRREVSGKRLWGWARDRFGTPGGFFARFFVANYCPLLFLEESGRNYTPDHLPVGPRQRLEDACDRALRDTVGWLRPRLVVGVGSFAERRARVALAGLNVTIGRIPHPSPASPQANRDWAGAAEAALRACGAL